MSDIDLKELVASLAISQKKTDEQLQRTDEQLQRTDKQLQRTDAKLDKVAKLLGNIGQNQGDIAEEFFYNSLVENTEVGGIKYDEIIRGMEKHRGNTQEEYDIVLVNENSIALIEVKYKANLGDIKKIIRKEKNFRKLFPIYSEYNISSGLATFHLLDDIRDELLDNGFFALQRSGNIVEAVNG